MKRLITIFTAVLSTLAWGEALAHPGSGLVVDRAGRIYFVLTFESRIMRINTDGNLTTFVRDPRLRLPHHLVIDAHDNLYTVSDHDGRVWRISPDGTMTEFFSSVELWRDRTALVGNWGDPFTIDAEGNLYCLAYRRWGPRSQILRISANGAVAVLAGSDTGYVDGRSEEAKFRGLHFSSMAWGPEGRLYVTDGTHIRIVAPNGMVSTLEIAEGTAPEWATGLTVGADGNVYVADYRGRRALKIAPGGKATTLADAGSLFNPVGVALGREGEIYVMDTSPFGTRVSSIGSDGKVTRLASINRVGTVAILLPLVPVLVLPALLVIWLWRRKPRGPVDAIVWSVLVGAIVVLTWVGGGMTPPGYPLRHLALLRHVILVLFAVTAVRSLLRTRVTAAMSRESGATA